MDDEEQELEDALREQKEKAEDESMRFDEERAAFAQEIANALFEHVPREVLLYVVAEILGALSLEEARDANIMAGMIRAIRPFALLVQSSTKENANGESIIDTKAMRENIENDPAFAEIKQVMGVVAKAFAAAEGKLDEDQTPEGEPPE